ncbi:TMV resistance protein N-like [Dorcoceras hygrometricum]|uniref:TMV resistance protein N-like n=1 Tax=Dorcoceras hygrometricum TaxID=472368 RepID=A0A2Z7A8Q4_9LAMI|nr:TMV resistance protein N-like [Dorcoceras hygrometricum]
MFDQHCYFAFLSSVDSGHLTGINRKSYSRRAQRHQSRSKQWRKSTTIYRRSVRMNSNYLGFTGQNDEKYRVQNTLSVEQHLSTRSVLGKCVYLVTLAMSLFDLQDVCIAIGSTATLDLPMVVDLIGIYGLKGPYCTLTTTNWFLQALSVIPRGSWGDVARRSC